MGQTDAQMDGRPMLTAAIYVKYDVAQRRWTANNLVVIMLKRRLWTDKLTKNIEVGISKDVAMFVAGIALQHLGICLGHVLITHVVVGNDTSPIWHQIWQHQQLSNVSSALWQHCRVKRRKVVRPIKHSALTNHTGEPSHRWTFGRTGHMWSGSRKRRLVQAYTGLPRTRLL